MDAYAPSKNIVDIIFFMSTDARQSQYALKRTSTDKM